MIEFNGDFLLKTVFSLLLLSLYSLVLNFKFGHQTFWRPVSVNEETIKRNSDNKVQKRSCCRAFSALNDDMTFVFGYLTSHELSLVCSVSVIMRHHCDHPVLWRELLGMVLRNSGLRQDSVISSVHAQLPLKVQFYMMMRLVPKLLLRASNRHLVEAGECRLLVMLHGEIFDLTSFQNDHPGGKYILQEVAGEDGAVLFERAGHSTAARELAKDFVLWSPVKLCGKRGMPAGVKQYIDAD